MPGEVGGEHADQHVALDPVLQAVEDRAQVQVVGFDVPEVAFDVLEVLVGGHGAGGVESVGGDGGADDVDPVEPGLGVDLVLLALDGQAGVGDGDVKCLAILYLSMTSPTFTPISAAPVQPAGGDPGDDRGEELLGGGEQVLALAGALGGQGGVAAGDQPLAGEVGGG